MPSPPWRSIAPKIRIIRAVLPWKLSRGNASTGPIATTCCWCTLHSTPGNKLMDVPSHGQRAVVHDVVVGHIRRFIPLALVPRGELGEGPAGAAVVRRVGVRVIVD